MLHSRHGWTLEETGSRAWKSKRERAASVRLHAFFWSGDARCENSGDPLEEVQTREGTLARNESRRCTHTKGEIWVEDARMREPFVIGFSRGKWVETREILAEAMAAATRRFVSKPWFQLAAAYCALSPRCTPLQFARTKFHSLPVLDKKENPQFGSLDIVSSSKTGFLSLFVDSPRSISPLT